MSFHIAVPTLHIIIVLSTVFRDEAEGLEISWSELVAREEALVQQESVQALQASHSTQVGKVHYGEIVVSKFLQV